MLWLFDSGKQVELLMTGMEQVTDRDFSNGAEQSRGCKHALSIVLGASTLWNRGCNLCVFQ